MCLALLGCFVGKAGTADFYDWSWLPYVNTSPKAVLGVSAIELRSAVPGDF